MDTATTLDKGHGRLERRTLKATTALNEYLDWPGVAQVGQVESGVVKDGKTSHEIRYFITSVSRPVAARRSCPNGPGAWSIENRSHYVRDVTMGEDASRIRKRSGPEVMAAFRNATIGWLRTGRNQHRGGDSAETHLRSVNYSPDWVCSKSELPCSGGHLPERGRDLLSFLMACIHSRLDGTPPHSFSPH